jgi:hypothetical protein
VTFYEKKKEESSEEEDSCYSATDVDEEDVFFAPHWYFIVWSFSVS